MHFTSYDKLYNIILDRKDCEGKKISSVSKITNNWNIHVNLLVKRGGNPEDHSARKTSIPDM